MRIRILILFLFLTVQTFGQNYNYERFEYSESVWKPHYQPYSKEPYGGFMLYEMLWKDFLNVSYNDIAITEFFKEYESSGNTDTGLYVIYAHDLHWRPSDYQDILNYVEKGNKLVICAEYLPTAVEKDFFTEEWISSTYSELSWHTISDNLSNTDESVINGHIGYLSNFKQYLYEWRLMEWDSGNSTYLPQPVLWTYKDVIIYRFQVGSGYIYFCSVPMLFSNIYLKSKEGKALYNWFFDRFKDHKLILDMTSAHAPVIIQPGPGEGPSDMPDMPTGSVLEHVLENKSLTWAYVLMLGMGLLYVLFMGKRKQAVIPLIAIDRNSSKEYIETVSSLYLSKRQHHKLIAHKRRNFLHFIRNRYHINGKINDTNYKEQVIRKSGADPELITRIFNSFSKISRQMNVDAKTLTNLHNDIELFYKTCA